jgi:hypothetical protein
MGGAVPDALLSLDNMEAPEQLQCRLCGKLFRDASLISCCGASFCDACIRERLIEGSFRCPACGTEDMTPDKLTSNQYLREVRRPGRRGAGMAARALCRRRQDVDAPISISLCVCARGVGMDMPVLGRAHAPGSPAVCGGEA